MKLLTIQKPNRMSSEEARLTSQVLWNLHVLLKFFKAGAIDPNDPIVTEIKAVAAEWLRPQKEPSISF